MRQPPLCHRGCGLKILVAWGSDRLVDGENYLMPDLPARTTNNVPVWGMLYPCEVSNVAGGAYHNVTAPVGADSARARASAASCRATAASARAGMAGAHRCLQQHALLLQRKDGRELLDPPSWLGIAHGGARRSQSTGAAHGNKLITAAAAGD